MIKANHSYIDKENSKINVLLDRDFETCIVDASGCDDVLATTVGSIKSNTISINEKCTSFDIYLKNCSSKTVLDFTFVKNGAREKESCGVEAKIEPAPEARMPIIFTGKGGMEFFKKRTSSRLIDCEVTLSMEEDLKISFSGKNKSMIVGLGEDSKELQSSDLVFTLQAGVREVVVPVEIIRSRFNGKEIALFLLVKPDFYKRVKNICYKSIISNKLMINLPSKHSRIGDFFDPVGKKLDPLYWIMDYNTNLPRIIC